MATDEGERRLAAILSADVSGYSRLMGDDERATVRTLNDYRKVFSEHIARHKGRVVDTAGDSVLAVFGSVVKAVQCAVDVQSDLRARNNELPEPRRMSFRVGINLGDVIEQDDGTIYGDGVNIAARLESLAEPGGIIVSGTVFDHAENKLPVTFEFSGDQAVKNIAKSVRTYRVTSQGVTATSPSHDKPLALSNKPSIAVLPFDNLGGDANHDYFADGIAEDLITALSRIRWMFVTARNSTFAYKGQSLDVKRVGKELGVRYVLEGSVRTGANRVRVSAKLIDATTGNNVWAERFDRKLVDLFDLQDDITETLVATLQNEVGQFERERAMRKSRTSLEAWDHYQRGMWHMYRFTADDNFEAQRYFRQAIELDPRFGSAYSGLAYACFLAIAMAYAKSPDQSRAEALEAARKALNLDEMDAMAHCALGRVYGNVGMAKFDLAIAELEAAIKINPSLSLAYFGLAHACTHAGRPKEALEHCDKAIRLSPHDPYLWLFQMYRGVALMCMKKHDDALVWLQASTRHGNVGHWAYAHLAACLGHLGRTQEAGETLEHLMRIKPDFSPDQDTPHRNPEFSRHFVEGLRKAGLDTSNVFTAND